MATKRELRIFQEDRLFDILFFMMVAGDELSKKAKGHLTVMREKAQSGMSASEVDAVKHRATTAYEAMYQKEV